MSAEHGIAADAKEALATARTVTDLIERCFL